MSVRERFVCNVRWARISLGLTCILLWSAAVHGQSPEASAVAGGNYSGSISNTQDRVAERALQVVKEHLRANDVGAAAQGLHDIFRVHGDSLVLMDDVYVRADVAAVDTFLNGGEELAGAYQRLYGPLGQQALTQALTRADVSDIRRVADEFQLTSAGVVAALHLAAHALDRGDIDSSRAWWRRAQRSRGSDRTANEPASSVSSRLEQVMNRRHTAGEQAALITPLDVPTTEKWTIRDRIASVPMSDGARKAISESLAELDAQSIVPLLSARPLIHEGVAFIKLVDRLTAVDVNARLVLWERHGRSGLQELLSTAHDNATPALQSAATALFLGRLVRSSLGDRLSADGSRVFTIVADSATGLVQRTAPEHTPPPPRNALLALDLVSGEVQWRAGAELDAAEVPADPALGDTFFLGVPTAYGRWRLVLGQQANVVSLLALEAESGKLDWSLPLGIASRPLGDDEERWNTACLVTIANGCAYCPTAAGYLACVDLSGRRVLWAKRYPREDLARIVQSDESRRAEFPFASRMPTRGAWHEVFIHPAGDTVVFATPESNDLWGLDAHSGRLKWRRPRGDGLYLAATSVFDDLRNLILIVGRQDVTAVSADDGRVQWTADTKRPAGIGVATRSAFIFPTQDGGLQSVEWRSGAGLHVEVPDDGRPSVRLESTPVPIVYGRPSQPASVAVCNLAIAGNAMLVQTADGLSITGRKEPTPAVSSADEQDIPKEPAPATEASSRVAILKAGGAALLQWGGSRPMEFRFPAVALAANSVRTAIHWAPSARSADERTASLLSELTSSDLKAADRSALVAKLTTQPLERLYLMFDRPRRFVRVDRWLQANLPEVDPSAAIKPPTTPPNPSEQDAAPAAGHRDGQQTGADRFDWASGSPSVTVDVPPRNQSFAARDERLYINPVPLSILSSSPWESVTIQIDRAEQTLWLSAADGSPPRTVRLPRQHPFADSGGTLLHAWVDGSFLLLRSGGDLFGLRLSHNGELPQGTCWPSSTGLSLAERRSLFLPALADTNESPLPLWDAAIPQMFDQFGRAFGIVGPIDRELFCYQDGASLVAIDPQTGSELWRRGDVPAGSFAVGNAEAIALIQDRSDSVSVLKGIDGSLQQTWSWKQIIEAQAGMESICSHIVAVNGTTAIWQSAPPQARGLIASQTPAQTRTEPPIVAAVDVADGRRLWSQTVPPDTWHFALDPSTLGRLTGEGTLSLCDWDTGETILDHRITVPEKIENVFVISYPGMALLVVSDRPDDRRLFGARQVRGAYRRPLVNGWMHAIDRTSGAILWSTELKNIGLMLDQPRHVPLIVTSYLVQGEQEGRTSGALKCYDLRSGELLYDEPDPQSTYIYHALRVDRDQHRIDLLTENKVIHFQYASTDPP